jgi:chemotaxis protein MotB
MAPPPLPGNQQPVIIIKKRRKRPHAAHHGGAWKVAYADFVTAMMAFFLLLWLLNVTTREQRAGIADYFSPASVSRSTSGSGGVLGGLTITVPGAMISPGAPVSFAQPTPSRAGESDKEPNQTSQEQYDRAGMSTQQIEENALREEMARREQRQFEQAEMTLRQAIQGIPELAQLADSLMIEQTPEGLRIQILDQANYSMFPLGSSQMYAPTGTTCSRTIPNLRATAGSASCCCGTSSLRHTADIRGLTAGSFDVDQIHLHERLLTCINNTSSQGPEPLCPPT